jgi:ANTAR domain
VGESSDHALGLIEMIVHEATCPVIAMIHEPDPDLVREASKRGIFAFITDSESEDWQNSIDIVLRRFAEYHHLEGAVGRGAVTERAKGILMERASVDESAAFEMLREHSRSTNRKLVDVASAVVDGHRLLPKAPAAPGVGHITDSDYQDRRIESAAEADVEEKDGMLSGMIVSRAPPRRPICSVAVHDQFAIASARSIQRRADPSALSWSGSGNAFRMVASSPTSSRPAVRTARLVQARWRLLEPAATRLLRGAGRWLSS